MKKRVLMLNSGGFDSAVLLHELVLKGYEVLSLFFSYGQNNAGEEEAAFRSMCRKLDQGAMSLCLPKFDWSKGSVVGGKKPRDESGEYVEMRNLVFLSYAVSVAETLGISEIYVAFLATSEMGFKDAQPSFVRNLNKVAEVCDIEIKTPYFGINKNGLANLAWYHGLKERDFFSCHYPAGGKPCRACAKCGQVAEVMARANETTPLKALVANGFDFSDETYRNAYRQSKLAELKLFINNVCEEKCDHCFYGFDGLAAPELSHGERMSVVRQAVGLGVGTVHICGREPFATPERLFGLVSDIKAFSPGVRVSAVTNGNALLGHEKRVKESGLDLVCLSVDGLYGASVRKTVAGDVESFLASLARLGKSGIDTCVFIAVHRGNMGYVKDTIDAAQDMGVADFSVTFVRPLGRGAGVDILEGYEVGEVFAELKTVERGRIDFFVNREYVLPFLRSGGFPCHPHEEYMACYRTGGDTVYVTDNLTLNAEFACSSYAGSVTVTADGYAVGCTAGLDDGYHRRSAGNVREYDLASLLRRGRESVLSGCPGGCHYRGR